MTELERAVLGYLRHRQVSKVPGCTCAADSWAPCGGQYEGRYAVDCPAHGQEHPDLMPPAHYPSGCWEGRQAVYVGGI